MSDASTAGCLESPQPPLAQATTSSTIFEGYSHWQYDCMISSLHRLYNQDNSEDNAQSYLTQGGQGYLGTNFMRLGEGPVCHEPKARSTVHSLDPTLGLEGPGLDSGTLHTHSPQLGP